MSLTVKKCFEDATVGRIEGMWKGKNEMEKLVESI
jgi:hypothetical protein